jgi:adenosylhomocysteine nucleosidase
MIEHTAGGRPLAIVAALEEEAEGLFREMEDGGDAAIVRVGSRDFHVGRLWGRECVLTVARIGKVAAATTTTALIHHFGPTGIIFTGVAGAASASVGVGDVVVAETLLQHDLDASPLFPRYEVPLTGIARFRTDRPMTARLAAAADAALAKARRDGGQAGHLHRGLIISGDQFIGETVAVARLRRELPDALAIEMEGAAAAQVCNDYGVPFATFRTISDAADDTAHVDFPAFLRDVARHFSYATIRNYLAGDLEAPR